MPGAYRLRFLSLGFRVSDRERESGVSGMFYLRVPLKVSRESFRLKSEVYFGWNNLSFLKSFGWLLGVGDLDLHISHGLSGSESIRRTSRWLLSTKNYIHLPRMFGRHTLYTLNPRLDKR